jgi:hypothetical protein
MPQACLRPGTAASCGLQVVLLTTTSEDKGRAADQRIGRLLRTAELFAQSMPPKLAQM